MLMKYCMDHVSITLCSSPHPSAYGSYTKSCFDIIDMALSLTPTHARAGHNGDAVSQLLADRMLAELSKRMPEQTAPQRFDTDSGFFYAEAVRRALAGVCSTVQLMC